MPDANPCLGRVLARTFVRDRSELSLSRRRTGALIDPTGFHELIAALGACRRNLDRVKIDVAAWSTVGMVRSGNEDGVSIFHTGDARLDDTDEAALIVLADGMGGMASGEVAAAIALHALRQELLACPPFSGSGLPVTPLPAPPLEAGDDDGAAATLDENVAPSESIIVDRHPEFYRPIRRSPERTTSGRPCRAGDGRLTRSQSCAGSSTRRRPTMAYARLVMGCTAEVILIDGARPQSSAMSGDSRVYRMRTGANLVQITRDRHPGRPASVELGQSHGGRGRGSPAPVRIASSNWRSARRLPGCLFGRTGAWRLDGRPCTDGLSNQVSLDDMQGVLRDARNAEPRDAVTRQSGALYDGAMDNVTVAVKSASCMISAVSGSRIRLHDCSRFDRAIDCFQDLGKRSVREDRLLRRLQAAPIQNRPRFCNHRTRVGWALRWAHSPQKHGPGARRDRVADRRTCWRTVASDQTCSRSSSNKGSRSSVRNTPGTST